MRRMRSYHKRTGATVVVVAVLSCGACGCALQEALIDGIYLGLSEMTAVLLGDALGTAEVANLDLIPDLLPGLLSVGQTPPADR